MIRKILIYTLWTVILTTTQPQAYAIDTGIDWLNVSGFGTLAATRANIDESSNAYFSPNVSSDGGARDDWTSVVDTRAGLQVMGSISKSSSATVQLISRNNYAGNYRPTVEWADFKHMFTPDLSIRLGRVGLPAFLISDYYNVGYAQPWIRPPGDAYIMMPMTYVDGGDAIFRFYAGNAVISVQPATGSSKFKVVDGNQTYELKASSVRAIKLNADIGAWTVHYGTVRLDTRIDEVDVRFEDKFNDIGFVYDKNEWLIEAEFMRRETSTIPIQGNFNSKMRYLTAGYRFGSVMPNITFSRYLDDSTFGKKTTQHSTSFGVRWDFYRNMALKVQYDHIKRPESSPVYGYSGLFNIGDSSPVSAPNAAPFRFDNKSVNIIAIVIDFVF